MSSDRTQQTTRKEQMEALVQAWQVLGDKRLVRRFSNGFGEDAVEFTHDSQYVACVFEKYGCFSVDTGDASHATAILRSALGDDWTVNEFLDFDGRGTIFVAHKRDFIGTETPRTTSRASRIDAVRLALEARATPKHDEGPRLGAEATPGAVPTEPKTEQL